MKITLCRSPFDRENDNVLLFNNKAALKAYMDSLTDKVPIDNINFDANDILNARIYVDIPSQLALFTLLNYNYCYVEQTGADTLYFFIEKSKQDSGNRIRLEVKLDIWNTYIYDCMSATKPLQALIQRAHVDRFIQSGENYIFNFQKSSSLFERETIKDVAKRVVSQEKLKAVIDTTNDTSDFNNWYNENIACWLYIYLSGNKNYSYLELAPADPSSPSRQTGTLEHLIYKNINNSNYNELDSNFVVLAAPIYKTNKTLYVRVYNNNGSIYKDRQLTIDSLYKFLENNDNFANVVSIKFSIIPPIAFKNYTQGATHTADYHIDTNLYLHAINEAGGGIRDKKSYLEEYFGNRPLTTDPWYKACFKLQETDNQQYLRLKTTTNFSKWVYTKNEIKQNEIEPKIDNEDYSTYRLVIAGQEFELPISKTSNLPAFKYKESLTPDITKGLLIFDTSSTPLTNGIFNQYTEKDFTGFSYTIDLSMWYPSNALDNYLANNKNYLQIFKNEQRERVLKTIATSATAMLGASAFADGKNALKTQGLAAIGAVAGTVNTLITNGIKSANFDLTIDNMRNAPEQTNNINSNPLLMQSITGIDFIIEKLEPLDFEKGIVKDYLRMYGYTQNCINNIYNYANIRKYYNYIQAIIFELNAPMSEEAKDQLKEIFIRGVRIWNGNVITQPDFTVNNYERYLDNE